MKQKSTLPFFCALMQIEDLTVFFFVKMKSAVLSVYRVRVAQTCKGLVPRYHGFGELYIESPYLRNQKHQTIYSRLLITNETLHVILKKNFRLTDFILSQLNTILTSILYMFEIK